MGSLKLPTGGLIYLDTNGFIYSVERIEPYYQLLIPMWEAAKAQQFEVVSSELALLECLVKPLRAGDEILANLFRAILHSREVRFARHVLHV